ncbi:uncharacterized protein JCM6883_004265 [Sporobolomyces salmoneus]|uniref:uncharacterized protein n=1 Tax=Sporobolomyces salmoneus TaxID=183962 RepID=UPI00317C7B6A
MLYPRGGAAAGDASHNPSDTTYAAIPPSSTYKGPKVAGTYGGFVGVFVAVGIFVLIILLVFMFLRFRTLRKRDDSTSAIEHGTELGSGRGGGGGREPEDDAFEMPRYERAGMESTLSFNGSEGGMSPQLGGRQRELYAHEGVSQDAFYDQRSGGTYDPYAETTTTTTPPRYDGGAGEGRNFDVKG